MSKDEGVLYVAPTTDVGGEVTELENPEGAGGGESTVTWDQYRGTCVVQTNTHVKIIMMTSSALGMKKQPTSVH